MIELFGPLLDVAIIAVCLSIFYQVLQAKFVDRKKMKANQEKMKEHQENIKHLMKRTDENAKKELENAQTEMLQASQEMLQGSMKMMLVSMIVVIPLWGFLGSNYEGILITLPVAVPFFSAFDWFNPVSWFAIKFYEATNWLGWYFLISIITSLVFTLGRTVLEKFTKVEKV
ncbi:MAG: EMC3/TMCO1 family protein [Candidatus Diapherotrites archaeon]|nr:EMC3/TMCO1 family protein [Candidatus Diapherotrites archaeon]